MQTQLTKSYRIFVAMIETRCIKRMRLPQVDTNLEWKSNKY